MSKYSIDKSPLGGAENGSDDANRGENTPSIAAIEAEAAIPKGTLDPVYEAKARVLNAAVRLLMSFSRSHTDRNPDPRYWNGMVSMAAFHRCRLWLGE